MAVAGEVAHEREQRQRGELVERAVDQRRRAARRACARRGRRAPPPGSGPATPTAPRDRHRPRRTRRPRRRWPSARASTTTIAEGSSRSRSSSRGWVTTGSARQSTTSSARSRISPKVAVLEPIDAIRAGGRAGVDHGPRRLGERHRPALRLAARPAEAVHERRARVAQDRGRGIRGLVDAHLTAVDARDRRPVVDLREPRVAERARPHEPVRRQLDVVADAAAPHARRVSHPPPPPRAAPRAAPRPAPRAPPGRPAAWRRSS